MNKETIKDIIYILIAIVLGIIAVTFVIWLLPIVLIAICSYYIYKYIKKHHDSSNESTKKDVKIIEMENNNSKETNNK